MDVTGECVECQGTGWVVVSTKRGSGAVRCTCFSKELADLRDSEVGLPPKVAHKTFDDFSAGDSKTERAKYNVLTGVMRKAKFFADEFPACKRRGLLFHGGSAEEMTHLGVATLKRFMKKGLSCLFCDYYQLLEGLRQRMDPDPETARAGHSLARRVLEVDVLLIDSLGGHRGSGWVVDTIGGIIKSRYYAERCLLATTRLPLGGTAHVPTRGFQEMRVPPRYHESLPDRIGRESVERLLAHCEPLCMTVPDQEQARGSPPPADTSSVH